MSGTDSDVKEQPLVPPRAIVQTAKPGIRVVRASELESTLTISGSEVRGALAQLMAADLIAVHSPESGRSVRPWPTELKDPAGRTPATPRKTKRTTPHNANRMLASWNEQGVVTKGTLMEVARDPRPGRPPHRARLFCSLNRDAARLAQGGEKNVARQLAKNAAEVEHGAKMHDVEAAARDLGVWLPAPSPVPSTNWVSYLRALRDSSEFRRVVLRLADDVDQARRDAGATADSAVERKSGTVAWMTDRTLGLRLSTGQEFALPVSSAKAAGLARLGAPAMLYLTTREGALTLEQAELGLSTDLGYLPARPSESGPEVESWRLKSTAQLHRGGAVRFSPEQIDWIQSRRRRGSD